MLKYSKLAIVAAKNPESSYVEDSAVNIEVDEVSSIDDLESAEPRNDSKEDANLPVQDDKEANYFKILFYGIVIFMILGLYLLLRPRYKMI